MKASDQYLALTSKTSVSKCVWGFPHQAKSLQCQLGVPQFNSIPATILPEKVSTWRSHRLRSQSLPRLSLSPLQMYNFCFWPTSYRSEMPADPLLGFLPDPQMLLRPPQFMKEHRWRAWWRKVLSGQKGPARRRLCSRGVWGASPSVWMCLTTGSSPAHRGFTIWAWSNI